MSKLVLLIEVILLAALVALGVAFALSNSERLSVDYLIGNIDVSAGVALLIMFSLGGVFGYLVRLPSNIAIKSRLLKVERELQRTKQA
ncbi:hypothetical protein A3715_06785 [Oleiphilus sp. HI0009]|uniref:LapA family protein n=1 Tax=unclassified Oleiphilus TaxID=2631174 RepID=UPI0007C24CEA|nr:MULTISPECIES: LapA family protein [unclassified Oleiphilus]KZX76199.1 hypothetical protein A3715_22075 [Oleiphilus sp. HI0009]MCH2158639.1 LapA family protein [Oleiphilaceae bacterium]KZX81702.1 hypothetical protein A3715_06785 [Oleiphilus sp. HI0009]KZY66555.1 hypothetical protein A3738_06220 [Oleiphilus sp. HI0066]KZY68740.1 hypothetical protein A3739_20075 [Oleiphilus sp. HI0067]